MECLITTTLTMLVNTKPMISFIKERYMWEGDPISLYIFIICAEYLDRHIHFMATKKGKGIGIK